MDKSITNEALIRYQNHFNQDTRAQIVRRAVCKNAISNASIEAAALQ